MAIIRSPENPTKHFIEQQKHPFRMHFQNNTLPGAAHAKIIAIAHQTMAG